MQTNNKIEMIAEDGFSLISFPHSYIENKQTTSASAAQTMSDDKNNAGINAVIRKIAVITRVLSIKYP